MRWRVLWRTSSRYLTHSWNEPNIWKIDQTAAKRIHHEPTGEHCDWWVFLGLHGATNSLAWLNCTWSDYRKSTDQKWRRCEIWRCNKWNCVLHQSTLWNTDFDLKLVHELHLIAGLYMLKSTQILSVRLTWDRNGKVLWANLTVRSFSQIKKKVN